MGGKYERYPFKVGEVLTLKKKHPCGNNIWKVERAGQEILVRCDKCGRKSLMSRRDLEKVVKTIE